MYGHTIDYQTIWPHTQTKYLKIPLKYFLNLTQFSVNKDIQNNYIKERFYIIFCFKSGTYENEPFITTYIGINHVHMQDSEHCLINNEFFTFSETGCF